VLAAINKAVEVEPNDPNVLFAKGRYYTLQKDTKEAITALRHLVQVRPDDSIANNNLAYHLLMAGGDEKEALHCAEVAQKGMPNDPFVVHTLGVAQLRVGDFEHSQKNLEMALQLKPGEPALLLDYGKLLIALQRKDEGRHHIEAALSYAKEMGLDFDRKAEAEEILSKTSAPDGIAAPTST
jgi:Flp pilus assembly protein TadD